jgi:hypothetical protein
MNKLAIIKTEEQFLEKYSMKNSYLVFKECVTIERCIRSEAPKLSSMRREYSREFTVKYIQLWILSLNEFLNISKKMNKYQIEETAEMIYDSFYYLNIADLNLFFRQIKQGKYELYESLDGIKLMNWLNEYCDQRMETSLSIGGINKSEYLDLTKELPEIKKIGNL